MKKKITRKSIIKKSIVWDDVLSMIRYSLPKFLFMGIIIGFLLFFLNLLIGLSNHANNFADTLQSKLGMYFYIKDLPWEENNVYTRVLHLQQKLEDRGVDTDFVSKDDAKQFLAKRIPDILEQFEYYGIESPFPATLYIMITSKESYEATSQVLPEYSDIILNVADITKWRTIAEQEKRIVRVMNFSNAVVRLSYFLIGFFVVIIGVIMFYMIQTKFQQFHDKIELKKLLWATYMQIKLPFLLSSSLLLALGFLIMILLLLVTNGYVHQYDLSVEYLAQLFQLDIELWDALLKNYVGTWVFMILFEMVVFFACLWIFAGMYLHRLVKKVSF